MKVNRDYLIPGCMLAEDVYKLTNTPIMRKKTVLTDELIQILKLFLIDAVHVEPTLVNGKPFKPERILAESTRENTEEAKGKQDQTPFIDRYLKAVQLYKRLFKNWQGGTKVDAYAVRSVFLPLYEAKPSKEDLIQLHHYNTKNDYIYYHAVAVSVYSYLLGQRAGLSNGEVIQLGIAGLLADSGMAKLPFNVYEKKNILSAEQYEEVKKHPILSYRMLEEVPGLSKNALLGVLQHHEREDGSGYPLKVKGNKLHQFARIIAVADVYHAMASETHYRQKQSPYKVLSDLKVDEFGRLDHTILQEFESLMLDLSIGIKVRMNNGYTGEVLYQNNQDPTRPIVKISSGELVNLSQRPDLFIDEELRGN